MNLEWEGMLLSQSPSHHSFVPFFSSVHSDRVFPGGVCIIQMEHRHRKKDTPMQASSHHLFVQMKSLMCSNLGEELEVIFSLFDSKENRPIR